MSAKEQSAPDVAGAIWVCIRGTPGYVFIKSDLTVSIRFSVSLHYMNFSGTFLAPFHL